MIEKSKQKICIEIFKAATQFVFFFITLLLVIFMGVHVINEVYKVPYKLCHNQTGLMKDPKIGYIWYDCNIVSNITISI